MGVKGAIVGRSGQFLSIVLVWGILFWGQTRSLIDWSRYFFQKTEIDAPPPSPPPPHTHTHAHTVRKGKVLAWDYHLVLADILVVVSPSLFRHVSPTSLRIFTGKKLTKIKLHCKRKIQIWTFESLVHQINSF